MNVIQSSTLELNPEALTGNDSLTPSVAAALIREFKQCPRCDSDLDPEPTNGKVEDRDVVWNSSVSGSSYHTCPSCGANLNVLVEEKANPTLYSSISDEPWADNVTWIETENNFVALTLNSLMVSC